MKHFTLVFLLSCSLLLAFFSTACGVEETDSCNLLPDRGDCEAYIVSYFFDTSTGKCTQFIYGGCDGVRPFATLSDCQSSCAVDDDTVLSDKDMESKELFFSEVSEQNMSYE